MTRNYCDGCGTRLNKKTTGNRNALSRLAHAPKRGLMFEIITGRDGVWNGGEYCTNCIIKAVNKRKP